MREEARRIVDLCKDFVRSMARVEEALGAMGTLTKEEREAIVKEVLAFIQSDEVKAPFTREIARELIGQLSAAGLYADYRGSPDAYIQ